MATKYNQLQADMKTKDISIIANRLTQNYALRSEVRDGREHLVVPVVMLVEGVHNGSQGPMLYTQEAISHSPQAWNGMPVTIHHPRRDEAYTSASDAGVASVGIVDNVTFSDGRLVGEAWLNQADLKTLSPEAYEQIEKGLPLDVSTGFSSSMRSEEGSFNNEEYIGIIDEIIPDHLALLPGSVGACSWDDGCGIRNEEEIFTKEQQEYITNLFNENIKIEEREGGPMETETKNKEKQIDLSKVRNGITTEIENAGFREISNQIQRRLDALDTNLRMYFLEEVFDDYFIYRVSNNESRESNIYKVEYQIADNDQISFDNSQAVEVRKVVTFETLEEKEDKPKFRRKEKPISNFNKQKQSTIMTENQKGTPCKVGALIANEATAFTEEDREWLENLDDSALDKLTPKEVKPIANETKPVEVNEDEIKKILNKTDDPMKFIDNFMPAALGKQMKEGLRMYENKRKAIIAEIVENSKFEEEQLVNWEDKDLDALHGSVVPTKNDVDYSFNNVGRRREAQVEENLDEVAFMLNLESEDSKN